MNPIQLPPSVNSKACFKAGFEILQNKDYTSIIDIINDKYLYWDKVKYQETPTNIRKEDLWAAVKLSRSIHARRIGFGKYSFTYNTTDNIQKNLHEFDLNIGGQSGSKGIIPEEDKKRYLISSVMEEAIASSQIEGAVTTRKKAKEMLRKNTKPRTKSEQMIVNNYITIRRITEIQNEDLTVQKLLEIHKLITSQTLDNEIDEGQFRESNEINVVDVTDGEIVHIPPDYKEINGLIEEFCRFFNDKNDKRFIHPIIKGCVIHFLIGFIHPFVDGNGRTARALFYWYLLSKGYWLTEYLSISRLIIKSKVQYALAYLYCEKDSLDLTYFINYQLKTMSLAYDSLREYIQRKINEKKRLTEFQRIDGINERQAYVIKWLYEEADLIFSIKEIETRFSVSNQTARTDLLKLAEFGFLDEIKINDKKKAFIRSDKFLGLIKTK
jgi:Fic family protein